jgi:hypothetical protein
MRMLQQLVEQRRMLVDDVRRLTNRITNALKLYFPQPFEWFKDKDTLVFCDFLTHSLTLEQAERARTSRLSAFFREHNVRYPHIIEARIRAIRAATALTSDAAVIDPTACWSRLWSGKRSLLMTRSWIWPVVKLLRLVILVEMKRS